MIRINLVPEDAGKRGAARVRSSEPQPIGFVLIVLGMLVAGLGSAFYGYTSFTAVEDAHARQRQEDSKKARLKTTLDQKEKDFVLFTSTSDEVDEKYGIVQGLNPENRVFWSEKLNMLALARIEQGVYITKLVLSEKIDELETPESIKRRDDYAKRKEKNPKEIEPRPIKRPVINQSLTIEAIAWGENSPARLRQITLFNDNLTSMTWVRDSGKTVHFTDGIKPEFRQLPQKVDMVGGVEVMRFGITCDAEPQLDRQTTATAVAAEPPAAASPAGGTK